MKYLTLNNGHTVPSIGLGTWKSSANLVHAAVRHALHLGYQHIDCAPIYMNEKPVGKAIKEAISAGEISRSECWITSKLWNSFHAPEDVAPSLKETLHFMQLDYLDCYLIHWPVATQKSLGYRHVQDANQYVALSDIPLTDTWEAMEELVSMGLVNNIGVSNFSQTKIADIIETANIPPCINQVECHPYLSQEPLRQFCQQHHITLTAYAPLGSADRPMEIQSDNEPHLLRNRHIQEIAHQHQATPAQVLIAWQLARNIIVIPKSTHPGRIEENLKATQLSLTTEDINVIDALNINHRYIDARFFEIPNGPYTQANIWA